MRPGVTGKWEDTGNHGWSTATWSPDTDLAATTAQLAGDLCRRATALRRTLYKLPGLINMRNEFLEIIKYVCSYFIFWLELFGIIPFSFINIIFIYRDVASEMKMLLDAAGKLAPNLPEQQRAELDLARRKLLETSRSFSNALKKYFKSPE